jgi:arginase
MPQTAVVPVVHVLGVASSIGGPTAGPERAPAALQACGLSTALCGPFMPGADGPCCRSDWAGILAAPGGDTPPRDSAQRWQRLGWLLKEQARLCAELSRPIGQQRDKLVVVGGDHSIAAGTWRGIGKHGGPPGLLWIDTHLDAHTPHTSPSGNPHGMPLAALLGHGEREMTDLGGPSLDPRRVVVFGVHSYEPEERALLRALGVRIFTTTDIARHGLRASLNEALAIVRSGPNGFGITLDIDAVDPSEAPGVSTPAANGLHGEELAAALTGLLWLPDCRAVELVEYNPERDIDARTARLLLRLAQAVATPPVVA